MKSLSGDKITASRGTIFVFRLFWMSLDFVVIPRILAVSSWLKYEWINNNSVSLIFSGFKC